MRTFSPCLRLLSSDIFASEWLDYLYPDILACRECGLIMQMLDTERLDMPFPLEHKDCTKVNVERVLLKYMTHVSHKSESDLWD